MRRPITILSLALAGPAAFAEPCNDIPSCAARMTAVTGQKYIWSDLPHDSKVGSSAGVDLVEEDADLVFTAMLDQSGLARVPVGDGKTYRIVSTYIRKDMDAPIIDASADKIPVLPRSWDWVMLSYRVKSPETARHLEQSFRPQLPRDARMHADENTGIVMITGTIPVVRRMYELFRQSDRPLRTELQVKPKSAKPAPAAFKST